MMEKKQLEKVGSKLKELREANSYTVEEISIQTRISISMIKALENAESQNLPGEVFVRGFIKTLCKFYRADAGEVLPLLSPEIKENLTQKPISNPKSEPKIKATQLNKPSQNSTDVSLLPKPWVFGVIASLIAAAVWMSLVDRYPEQPPQSGEESVASFEPEQPATEAPQHQTPEEQIPETLASQNTVPPPTAPKENSEEAITNKEPPKIAEQQPPTTTENIAVNDTVLPPDQLRLSLNVKEAVQIRIKLDQNKQETLTLQPNQYNYQFKNNADLLIFDASALSISFNNKDIGPLGQKSRVRRLSFVKSL